jgi:hypothetical protein
MLGGFWIALLPYVVLRSLQQCLETRQFSKKCLEIRQSAFRAKAIFVPTVLVRKSAKSAPLLKSATCTLLAVASS